MKPKPNGKDDHRYTTLKPASTTSAERGFTLVEVTIALFLIIVALLGVASTTVIAIKGNSFSQMMTTATTLAQGKMEDLVRDPGNAASGGPETVQTNYVRGWTVTPDSPAPNIKTIVVTVTWPWQGQSHSVVVRGLAGT